MIWNVEVRLEQTLPMHSKPSLPSPLYRYIELPFNKIMGYLDNPSVLTLGKVSWHDFNHTALSSILGLTIVDGILARSKFIISHKQLCVARWLPAAITSFEYIAARDFVDDMVRLALLLSRLPRNCLEILNLEASVNTTSKSLVECGEMTTHVWTRALSKLVDVAILVGRSQIVIRTNYLPDLQWIYPFPPSPPPSRSFSRRHDISRLFSRKRSFYPTAPTIRLKSLTFATVHFFTGAFFELRNQSFRNGTLDP
ncbi:hypothetical protein AN958_03002 [Leucoagaricus sp. SymC.cos]|nr:hypothetical protein AN958_03002 [Leucoagaricus sp. SymC.cos]